MTESKRVNRDLGPYDWRYYLTWEGRISPRAYVVGGQVLGVAGFFAVLAVFGFSMLWTVSFMLPIMLLLVVALVIPGSSLLVRRAHDLGWPALHVLAVCLVPTGLLLALIAPSANFGADLSESPWRAFATSTPVVLTAVLLNGVVYLWLALKKGQPMPNWHGPAPP